MFRIRISYFHVILTAAVALSLALAAPSSALAEIKSLTVLSSKDIGPFRGKPYRELDVRMDGVAPGGAYAVPITLALPQQTSDHNGFAIVDIINTATVGDGQFVIGGGPFPLARTHMGDDFLFGTGNVYVGVMWDKATTDALKIGTIKTLSDGHEILRDAAVLARNPAKFLPADAGTLPSSGKIIAYGFSQTGRLLRAWYLEHLNSKGGTPVFDGALVAGAVGSCYGLATGWYNCGGALSDGGKVIVLSTETDAEWGGHAERADDPNYRVYEIAGVSHIPSSASDFREHGMPEQNPVDFGPAFRAALVNLEQWLNGKEPPPNVFIEISQETSKKLDGVPIRAAVRDADGNAKGGVRLPHMPTMLPDGRQAGAPLGGYTGLGWDHANSNFYFTISGTFAPFPPEKIKALYPDNETYVAAIAAAAEDLVANRHILPEDADAYVGAAKRSSVGLN